MVSVSGGADTLTLQDYQTSFTPLLYGVGLAIVLTLFLKETGPAVRQAADSPTHGATASLRTRES
jgi:hypothetical protein